MPTYLRYSDDLETPEPNEAETFRDIADLMIKAMHRVDDSSGTTVRVSHAKAHALVEGELIVARDLPPELAQGLFAKPGAHPVLVRVSQAPGEVLDDRKVSSPRGMAIKVFEVEGPKLAGHEGETTQDFVLETGKAFLVANAAQFKQAFKPNTLAPLLPEAVKGAVSHAARAANAALHAIGTDSGNLDLYGHPTFHPMGEAYFSQAALRYGDYVAKISVTPANAALEALYKKHFDVDDHDAVRNAAVEYFRTNPAEFAVNVQLATDPRTTPIEDASVEWPEDVTPYREVARLVLPAQAAYAAARADIVEKGISFFPGHALTAHRPLGSIMRARLHVYPIVSSLRREENGRSLREPKSLADTRGTN